MELDICGFTTLTKLLAMAGHYWPWLAMDGHGWCVCVWPWLAMAGHGWPCFDVCVSEHIHVWSKSGRIGVVGIRIQMMLLCWPSNTCTQGLCPRNLFWSFPKEYGMKIWNRDRKYWVFFQQRMTEINGQRQPLRNTGKRHH